MKILTSATVSKLKKGANSVTATMTVGGKAQEITVDRVISAPSASSAMSRISASKAPR
jgi:dihydrolipoamide dehydrogenase